MRLPRIIPALLVVFALLPTMPVSAGPAPPTLYVDINDGTCDNSTIDSAVTPYCDIQPAVNDAVSGTTIEIAAGTYLYAGSGVMVVDLFAGGKDLVFNGAGEDATFIDGENTRGLMRFYGANTYEINDLTMRNGNSSGSGAGLTLSDSGTTVHVTNVTIKDSIATASGGGAYLQTGSVLDLTNVTFDNTDANSSGAGIFVNGATVHMDDVVITNADAAGGGGAIAASGNSAEVQILNSTFDTNTTVANGAAINFDSTGGLLEITDSIITGNNSTGYGGGIYMEDGTLTITRSVLYDNRALGQFGGAMMTNGTATITIRDSTISGNKADTSGGGLFLDGSLTMTLFNVTVTNNTAENANGGGIQTNTAGARPTLRNTILAGNFAPNGNYPDCSDVDSDDYNLIGDVTTSSPNCNVNGTTTNNIHDVDPGLGTLTYDSDAETWVHPLLASSPALDAGDPATPGSNADACAEADQRGVLRDFNRCDIGAYELQTPSVTRLAGDNRFGTGAAVVQEFWPGTSDTVIVANGYGFPDALTGSNLYGLGAPLLLVASDSIPQATSDELDRLDPTTIYILGGEAVVDASVATALSAWGTVIRLSGSNRYATAVDITQEAFPGGVDTLLIASGVNFPDALAGGAAAAKAGAALLITAPDSLPATIQAEIERLDPDSIYVLGGSAAISDAVFATLQGLAPSVERVSGSNRYTTAVEISAEFFASASKVLVATGLNFPDALAGTLAAGGEAPVLLIPGASVPAEVSAEITRLGATTIFVLGGEAVIDAGAFDALEAIIGL